MPVPEPTVFIVDDDPDVRGVLRRMAETVQLHVETFSSAKDFLKSYDPERRGYLLLDVRLPEMSGLELFDELTARKSELPVIMMSGHGEVQLAVRAVKSGALDYLEKPVGHQALLELIYAALALDARQRQQHFHRQADAESYATLTGRERQVMSLLVAGKAGKQIADELGVSYKTMEKFRGKVMQKMGADSVAQLVFAGINLGLVTASGQTGEPTPES
ncbi:MAG TPA: response regulator [Planctomycetaceae bacterium]